MITPFPKDPAGRKALGAQMTAASPALMADVAEWRQLFPGARLTHFKAPGIEVGTTPKPTGWLVDEDLSIRVASQHRKDNPEPEAVEAKRVAKKTSSARKRR